jgi:O-antigen ligase
MTNILSALFGLALTVAYVPGISGAATAPRWDVAALLAVAFLFMPRVRMTGSHWLGLALIGWLILTIFWSAGRLDGVDMIFKMLLAIAAFAIGSTLIAIDALFAGAAFGLAISSGFAIAQYFGFQGLPTYGHGSAGLWFNTGRLGAVAAMVVIWVVPFPGRWPLLPLLLPGLVLSGSRAAWLAVVAGLVAIPGKTLALRILRYAAGAAAVTVFAVHGFDVSIDQHHDLAMDTINALTPFGHGLGSFWETFPAHAYFFDIAAVGSRPLHPHNEWLWLAYEGGAPAFLLGSWLAWSLWSDAAQAPHRGILAGLFVLSLCSSPFHDPGTLILGSLLAGWIAGNGDGVRDAAFDGGIPVRKRLAAVGPEDWNS